jgi:hypothetical protein
MAEVMRRIRPKYSDAYLANPHKGCCTFQHFAGDELFPGTSWSEEGPREFPPRKYQAEAPGYLPSTVSYCRWFWAIFEPEEGKYDFSAIERSIETARARGQTLAIRIMAFGSGSQPQVPEWYARKYALKPKLYKSSTLPFPDHDSADYLEKFGNIIRECGRRYDGHPVIETMDIGYIGPWGEGHGECSPEQCRKFNQVWKEAFPTTPRLVEICGEQGRFGIEQGSGWRLNCYGDLSDAGSPHVSKNVSWNHMYDVYADTIIRNAARDRWQTQPIHFESCWVPMYWYDRKWEIDFILQQGLKYHITYFMPKSTALPEAWLPKLAEFCRHIGYRYAYRQALYETRIKPGSSFKFHTWIENVGVAPIYRRYNFALRLRQGDHEEIIPVKDVDIRTWLPGDSIIDTRIALPPSIKPGWIDLSAGLIEPASCEARVSFATQEQYSDRWTALGGIEVL